MRKLTEKGRLFEEKIEAEKDHLAKVREAATRRGGVSREGGDESEDENPFVGGRFEKAMVATLDADDYLQRDVDSLSKATLLSICSDMWRNPQAEGYDMSIPPATYWEAERRTDAEEWKKVMEKELGDLERMGVYKDVSVEGLLEGKKPISCQWVYEFKLSESGGPPIYKAHLVAQGFSQVPFVDYGATFAPVAKSITVHFVAVYSALQGWHLQCFDATRAFLHGGLTNKVFMRRPPPLPRPLAPTKVHIWLKTGEQSVVLPPSQSTRITWF